MLKKLLGFLMIFSLSTYYGQEKNISVSTEAEVVGGKEAIEQVLQTQLTLPKVLLTKNFSQQFTVYFELDSLNHAKSLTFNVTLNNVLRKEIIRIMRFLEFKRKTAISETPYEYYLNFSITTDKYNKYAKQRTKAFLKPKPADSSFVVFSKADRSPEYYKKGEEGLAEFVVSEIQYPDVAREKSIEGTVVLEFVVETNGYVTNIEARQGIGGGCTEEAMRVISQTKWIPAEINNKYVRYKITYPITFNLRNTFRDNSSSREGGY